MKIKVRMPQKTKPSLSDLGSLYVIYMIIIIKFHATEFLNMINLLRALRFTFEELFAFKRIFLTLSTLVAFGKFGPIDMKNRNKPCFVNTKQLDDLQPLEYDLRTTEDDLQTKEDDLDITEDDQNLLFPFS